MFEQFDQLSHPVHHRILEALNERNPRQSGEFTAEELADGVDDAGRLGMEIQHNHLPKNDDAGFIDWDRGTDTVTRGPRFDELSPLLDFIDDYGDGQPKGTR